MREFFLNVTRYPRYLVAFTLGVMNSVAEPLANRRQIRLDKQLIIVFR